MFDLNPALVIFCTDRCSPNHIWEQIFENKPLTPLLKCVHSDAKNLFCFLITEFDDKFVWFQIFIKPPWEKCSSTIREFTRRPTAMPWEQQGKLHKNVWKSYFSQLLRHTSQTSQSYPSYQSGLSRPLINQGNSLSRENKNTNVVSELLAASLRTLIINQNSYNLKVAG